MEDSVMPLMTIVDVDGVDVEVTTMANWADNLDGKKALITASLMNARLTNDNATIRPIQMDEKVDDSPSYGYGVSTLAHLYAFNGSKFDRLRIDNLVKILPVLDAEHYQIHAGVFFSNRHFTTLGAAGSQDYLIKVGASKNLHFKFEIGCEDGLRWYLYENPTITANGTALALFDHDRQAAATSTAAFYHTPTNSALGSLIDTGYIGANGSYRSEEEWILKKSEDYIIRLLDRGAGGDVSFRPEWYEI